MELLSENATNSTMLCLQDSTQVSKIEQIKKLPILQGISLQSGYLCEIQLAITQNSII